MGRHRTRTAGLITALVLVIGGCTDAETGRPSGIDRSPGSDDNVVTLYFANQEYLYRNVEACNAKAGGEYQIVHRVLPPAAADQRKELARLSAAKDTDIDLLGLDVTWVPEFAEAGWLAEWTGANEATASAGVLPAPLHTATWNDKTYAATMNTNVQLLFYDKTLTPKPPKTWDAMIAQSRALKAKGKPHRILFTAAQYEGLVVTFNNLVAAAGGRILSADGSKVVLDNGAAKALELLAEVSTNGLADPSLDSAKEPEVSDAFAEPGSKAAFQINWPYAYPMTHDTNPERAKNLRWTTLPGIGGKPGRATVGGFNLGVSPRSGNSEQAFEAALCLRDADQQKYAAICGGVPPTLESIFTDDQPLTTGDQPGCGSNTGPGTPTMEAAFPMRKALLKSLKTAAIRPLTPDYAPVSDAITEALSPVSEIDPEATLESLRAALTKVVQ